MSNLVGDLLASESRGTVAEILVVFELYSCNLGVDILQGLFEHVFLLNHSLFAKQHSQINSL